MTAPLVPLPSRDLRLHSLDWSTVRVWGHFVIGSQCSSQTTIKLWCCVKHECSAMEGSAFSFLLDQQLPRAFNFSNVSPLVVSWISCQSEFWHTYQISETVPNWGCMCFYNALITFFRTVTSSGFRTFCSNSICDPRWFPSNLRRHFTKKLSNSGKWFSSESH